MKNNRFKFTDIIPEKIRDILAYMVLTGIAITVIKKVLTWITISAPI